MNKKIRQRLGLHFYAVGLWRIFLLLRCNKNKSRGCYLSKYANFKCENVKRKSENLKG